MTNVNFYEEVKKYGINTYGFDIAEVIKSLSADMADKFAKATEDLSKAENRALVQAVYKTYMGMRAVTGGNYKLSDSAIVEMQGLILGGKE
jgi:hypothetical protein